MWSFKKTSLFGFVLFLGSLRSVAGPPPAQLGPLMLWLWLRINEILPLS